jgi:drug/metabolite transporter (DMT)-like permease
MRVPPLVALALGLLLVSTAGPMLVASHMDAFTLAALRLLLGGTLLLGWAIVRGTWRPPAADVPRLVVGGFLLGAHFALWVKAFDLTDYASNLLLLVSQPAIAAVIGARLGERQGRETWISISLSLAGLSIIAGGDVRLGFRAILGDLLCLVGAFAVTLFVVVTRRARAEMHLPAFLGWVFLLGGAMVAPVALIAGDRLQGYPAASWGWLAALVLLTTIGGHGFMNLAARDVRLFTLNLVIVLEPPLAIALGTLLFGATVTPLQVAGGILLGAAVVVGMLPELRTAPAVLPPV